MTDKEIIKALECCSMGSYPACRDCPYHDDYVNRGCINKRNADIKDLINRQKAEIKRLRKETSQTIESIRKLAKDTIRDTKSEAIKEFAEKLKEKRDGGTYPYVLVNVIDNLVKEMVGE